MSVEFQNVHHHVNKDNNKEDNLSICLHSASLVFAIAFNTVGDSSRRDRVEKTHRWLVIKLDGGEKALADDMKWIPRNRAGTNDIRRRLALLRLRMMKGEEIIIYFSSIGLEIEDYQLIISMA